MTPCVRAASVVVVLCAVLFSLPGRALAQTGVTLTVAVKSVYARSAPSWTAAKTASLFKGQTFPVSGRNGDGSWVKITVTGITADTWVAVSVGEVKGNLDGVPVTAAGTSTTTTAAAQPTATPKAQTTSVVSTVVRGGLELGGQVADFSRPDLMTYAGMTWVKRQARWAPGERAEDRAGLINDAHSRGFKILLSVIGSSPSLAASGNFAAYAQYLAGLAGLGADGIEVWNEMNIDREWPAGQISASSYTSLLQPAYGAIKAANSGTLVISGAPAPTGYFGGCSGAGCDDAPYITSMVAAGALNYMDCLGIHYNEGVVSPTQSSGDPRGNPNHYTRYYQTMVDTYYNAGGGRRQLCFTELGYLSGEEWGYVPGGYLWKGQYNLTVAEQAQFLADAARLSMTQGRVRLQIVFNVDFTAFGDDPMAGFAMIRPGGSCPACDSLRAVTGGR